MSRWTTILTAVSCKPPRYRAGFLDILQILQCRLKTPGYSIQHLVYVSFSVDNERNVLLYSCNSTWTFFLIHFDMEKLNHLSGLTTSHFQSDVHRIMLIRSRQPEYIALSLPKRILISEYNICVE